MTVSFIDPPEGTDPLRKLRAGKAARDRGIGVGIKQEGVMEIAEITMDKKVAREHFRVYRKLMRGFRALSKGQQVIDLFVTTIQNPKSKIENSPQ